MTDVPFGVLLSGGLDSSLVASVTKRHLVETEAAKKFGTELHSFVVGLEVLFGPWPTALFHPAGRRECALTLSVLARRVSGIP